MPLCTHTKLNSQYFSPPPHPHPAKKITLLHKMKESDLKCINWKEKNISTNQRQLGCKGQNEVKWSWQWHFPQIQQKTKQTKKGELNWNEDEESKYWKWYNTEMTKLWTKVMHKWKVRAWTRKKHRWGLLLHVAAAPEWNLLVSGPSVCLSILLREEWRARVLQEREAKWGEEEWFLSAEANW